METKTNIYKAIAAFQQEVPVIHKGTKGYGYSYTNLTDIFKVINPLLKKHGLGFTQLLDHGAVHTIIFHAESGEEIHSEAFIPKDVQLKGMNAFQVMGSAVTYMRRYALSSMLGLVTDADLDACGEQISNTAQEVSQEVPSELQIKIAEGVGGVSTLEDLESYWNEVKEDIKPYKPLLNLFKAKKVLLKKELAVS